MPLVVKDRVKVTTTTTGTGTLTLGAAAAGFQNFSVIGNANTTYYAIVDSTAGTWEVGLGTYTTSGTTLSRDTVLESSNAGSLVNFAAGSKDVFVTYPAERAVYFDTATNTTLNALTVTGVTTVQAGTAAAPAVTTAGDTNTGIFFPAADTIAFAEGGTEVMRIDSAGNVGIGTVSADAKLTVNGAASFADGSAAAPSITNIGDTNTGIFFPAADTIAFAEGGVEAARITSAANLQFNSGYGSVATAYGCRAWVNFNGTGTPAIRNDGNVTSITDNGTGDYTVNFTDAMPDINYAVVATGISISTGTSTPRVASVRSTTDSDGVNSLATGSVRIGVRTGAGGSADIDVISVAIFR